MCGKVRINLKGWDAELELDYVARIAKSFDLRVGEIPEALQPPFLIDYPLETEMIGHEVNILIRGGYKELRALQLACNEHAGEAVEIFVSLGGEFKISSSSRPGTSYATTPNSCTCPGFRYRGHCKHIDQLRECLISRPAAIMEAGA